LTAATPYARVLFQDYAPAISGYKRVGRADFGAGRFRAGMADGFDESPRDSPGHPDFYTALFNGMVLPVRGGADKHACKTPNTSGHISCF